MGIPRLRRDERPRYSTSVPAAIIGALSALAGLTVVIRWGPGSEAFTGVSASLPRVKANAALIFALSGISLALLGMCRAVRTAEVIGGFTAAAGLLTLVEYATGWNAGIDELLVSDQTGAIAPLVPGRMSPNAAVCFILLGAALALVAGEKNGVVRAQILAVGSAIVGLVSTVGALFDVPISEQLIASSRLTPMAPVAGGFIILLSVGVVLVRPDIGALPLLRMNTPGGILRRRLLIPALLFPLVVGFILLAGHGAGYYTWREALALFATLLAGTLALTVWLTAAAVDHAHKAKLSSEAQNRTVLETAVDGLVTIDRRGTILGVNSAVEQIFGRSKGELLGEELASVLIPERLRDAHRAGMVRVAAYPDKFRDLRFESFGLRADGQEFPIEISIGRPEGVEPAVFVGNIRDISEKARLESELRQAQKIEAVGQLAGGIAHDFNNLLTVITGYGDLARREIGSGPGSEELDLMTESADRATELVHQLLAFSRQQVLQPEVLDLKEVVNSIVPMLRPLIGEDISMTTSFDPGPCTVFTDRGQLEQVIVNLAVNARDAMPRGGSLLIEASPQGFERDTDDDQVNLKRGEYVALKVTDTGTGIAPEAREHLFEPFFTTKPVGKGTGLGLATVHGIVLQSGGDIHVYSEPEFGTTMKVFLPFASAPRVVQQDEPEAPADTGGQETVLVCEDDAAVRRLIERILTGAGYETLVAATPMAALALIERGDVHVEALITDVIMPEMAGPELAEAAQARRPDDPLPVLMVSGYTPDTIRERASLPEGAEFVEKPFDREVLLTRLRTAIENCRTSSR